MYLRILSTFPVTVASCEGTFNKLRLIKNYFLWAPNQEHTFYWDIESIEDKLAQVLNFGDIIHSFEDVKVGKVCFEVGVTKYQVFYCLSQNVLLISRYGPGGRQH